MTYQELKDELDGLNEDELQQTVTIYDTADDEYFGVDDTDFSVESDVMDDGQFVILLDR